MNKPYIGVTGFMTREEAEAILASFLAQDERLLMVGVLASLKTLQGIPNRWPNRFPSVDKIAEIFPEDPRALNLIHYSTDERETLSDQLEALVGLGGPNFHGFQLNISWPDIKTLEEFKRENPGMKIVLQMGATAFNKAGNRYRAVAEKIQEYTGMVDYVLFDPSGGYGIALRPDWASEIIRASIELAPDLMYGVAGGLSYLTLPRIGHLICEYPNISLDAEGKLRDKEDRLDLEAAKAYVLKALAMFTKARDVQPIR